MKVSTTSQEQLKLFRADISPYQGKNFAALEQAQLHSLGHQYVDQIKDADILITNTHTKLERFTSSELKNIKLIIHPNSGYDNFDVPTIKGLTAPVVLGNRIRAKAVANYTLACLYQSIGEIPNLSSWDKNRSWQRKALEELKIQIIGHGHIGKILHNSLIDSVASIAIFDPYKNQNPLELESSDIIIFACGLNQKNHHFLNEAQLARLKDEVIIINPARGKLIDGHALKKWLNSHPRAKAYLDVFEVEPADFTSFPPNCKCTSHIAGVDESLDKRIIDFVCEVTQDFARLGIQDFTHKWQDVILSNRIIDDHFI